MTPIAVVVLQTVSATAALVCGLFFLRFWREHRDPLFALFSGAFFLLALSWFALACLNPVGETQSEIYGIRLVAFALIIAAIVQKNRRVG